MPDDRKALIIRLPRKLKQKIAIEATRREMSQQDLTGQILARHFGIAWESRRSR